MTNELLAVLLDASLRSAVLGAAVWLLLRALRVRAGAARHTAWTCIVLAMLVMPVLPAVVPGIPLPAALSSHPAQLPVATSAPVAGSHNIGNPAPSIDVGAAVPSARDAGTPAAPPEMATPVATATPIRPSRLPLVLVAIYVTGVAAFAAHLLVGWLMTLRLRRASLPVQFGTPPDAALAAASSGLDILECRHVATSLTVGIVAPAVILPSAWREWPSCTLRAALAHERAHVQRYDGFVAFLARLNRSVFWFHPLAWWLRRELAAAAELASDDEAIGAIGSATRYAEALVDMARAAHARGGRFSWQGIGIDGAGLLSHRIDRVLGGDLPRRLTRLGRSLIVSACVVLVFGVAACRQRSVPPPPLVVVPDAVSTDERIVKERAERELIAQAEKMTPEQAKALDAQWQRNREDLETLKKLLLFYKHDFSGKKNPDQARLTALRRPYILWLIEHHPEHEMAGSWAARIFATPLDPLPDPEGYAAAKRLWLAAASQPNVGIPVLSNAAYFFETNDKPLAEEMLLKAQALDPNRASNRAPGDTEPEWSRRIGRLYALVLVGCNASTPLNVVRYSSLEQSRSPYAQSVRAKLDASQDAALLSSAAGFLTFSTQYFSGTNKTLIDFDPNALGISYLERAAALDSQSATVRARLVQARSRERHNRFWEMVRADPQIPEEQLLARVPEADRLELLITLADRRYFAGEHAADQNDQQRAKSEWERSRANANDILALAAKHPDSPSYSSAVFNANMALSTIAMREGNQKQAVEYMLKASMVPSSEELAYQGGIASALPIASLLKYGERDSVIEYMERMAGKVVSDKKFLQESAEAIRRGQAPRFYAVQIKD